MKKILIIFIVIFAMESSAQDFWKVLVKRGNVILKSDETKSLIPNSKISSNSIVELGVDSYLGLIHNSGKCLEIREVGVHNLAEKEVDNPRSITKRYGDFIMKTIHKDDNSIKSNHHQYMAVTGAVERGGLFNRQFIKLLIPSKSKVFTEGQYEINWRSVVGVKYVVNINDMFGEPIWSKETGDTLIKIDFRAIPNLEGGCSIEIWDSNNPKRRSKEVNLEFVSGSQMEVKGALEWCLLGNHMEEEKFFLDALNCWRKAVMINGYFRENLEDFLKKMDR